MEPMGSRFQSRQEVQALQAYKFEAVSAPAPALRVQVSPQEGPESPRESPWVSLGSQEILHFEVPQSVRTLRVDYNWALEYHTLILFWDLLLKGNQL